MPSLRHIPKRIPPNGFELSGRGPLLHIPILAPEYRSAVAPATESPIRSSELLGALYFAVPK